MKVNGNERAVPAEGTVLALLKELGHDPQRVAVEKNGTIIPRAQFADFVVGLPFAVDVNARFLDMPHDAMVARVERELLLVNALKLQDGKLLAPG